MNRIFDPALVIRRKRRARARPMAGADFLLRHAADELCDRLLAVRRDFAEAAVIQDYAGQAEAALNASGKAGRVRALWMDESGSEILSGEPDSLDLAVSLYHLHELNDLPGMLIQIRRLLKPDGLLLACLAGSGTLAELRDSLLAAESAISGGAGARIIPFADVRDMGALLQRAGFALPVTDVEQLVARYDDMFALLRDLRAMGATSSLEDRLRRPSRRDLFMRAAEIYADRHADADGRIRATFSTIWLSGWSPHRSQQKPLAPGSAQVPLSQVLGPRGGDSG